MVYEIEFFFTGLFFLLFFIIITLFGFLLIFLFYKKILNFPLLETIAISLGCGIVFYIFYSYIIEIFLFFNFFTIMLPIIIFDIIGFIFVLKFDARTSQKINFTNFKHLFIKNKNAIIIYLFFFIIIFLFQIQVQYLKIIKYETLFSKDPFYWCKHVLYIIDFGKIDYSELKSYSAGMLFIHTGMVSFYPNFRFIYFFHKFIPFFLTSLIIFIGFIASKMIFKKKFLVFITMFGFLTLRYFNYRFLMTLPSVLATITFFIFTIIFINPRIPFFFKGILLAGPMLCHPILGGFSFSIFIIYIILHFLLLVKSGKEYRKKAYGFLKENVFNILIFIGLISPYLPKLIDLILWYFNIWYNVSPTVIAILNGTSLLNGEHTLIINLSLLFAGSFSFSSVYGYLNQFIIYIWRENLCFFFFFFYFFIRIKKKNYKNHGNFIEILKISIVFLILFHFLNFFIIWFFPSNIFGTFFEWLNVYAIRIFEFGSCFFILMAVFVFHDIYLLLSKLTKKLKKKFPFYKKFLKRNNFPTSKKVINHMVKSQFKIESIFIIFALIFAYNLYNNNYFWYSYTYTDDRFIEMMLDLGDCEPSDSNITILIPTFDKKVILNLLYRYNLEYIDFNQNYTELTQIIVNRNASYIVIPIGKISEVTLRNLIFSYKIFYEYSQYIVLKTN